MKSKFLDILERVIWTAIQVVTAGGIVTFFNLDLKWAAPIAVGIAIIKNVIASQFGNGTASTLPISVEPLPPTISSDGLAAVVTSLPEGTTNDATTS